MATDTSQSGTWRKRAAQDSSEAIRRSTKRWQSEPQRGEGSEPALKRKKFGLRTIGWLLASFGTLALLLYLLLYDPNKTPTITLAATNYAWPLPPTAWAAEDVAKFHELDNATLRLFDLSDSATSKEDVLDSVESALKSIARQPNKNRAVVIYINMIGLVDARGTPCLAALNADPLDRSTWLPVSDLLGTIHSTLPANINKLILLDAAPVSSAWELGMVESTFAERLPAVVDELEFPNLAVLHSADAGQQNLGTAEIKASPFGYFTQLGLAGAADREEIGNKDGAVSLKELHAYLDTNVNRWALENRGVEQVPMLLPANAADFHIAFRMQSGSLARLEEAAATVVRAAPSVSAEQIETLWEKVHRLNEHAPVRYAPLAWARMQNQLLWLERAAIAGSAYEESARREHQRLDGRFDTMLQQATESSKSRSLPLAEAVFTPPTRTGAHPLRPHSIALGEYLGVIDSLASSRAGDALNRFAADAQIAGSGVADFNVDIATAAGPQSSLQFDDFYFLHTAASCQVLPMLRDQGTLTEIMNLRRAAEQVATPTESGGPGDPRVHRFIRALVEQGDQHRRAAEDGALLGLELDRLRADIDAATTAYSEAAETMTRLSDAVALRDTVRAEAPYLAHWLCASDRTTGFDDGSLGPAADLAGNAATKTARDVIEQELLPLIEDTRELSSLLGQPLAVGSNPVQTAAAIVDSAASVESHWSRLRKLFENQCEDLSDSNDRDPRTLHAIDAALAVPHMASTTRQLLRKRQASVRRSLAEDYFSPADESETNDEKGTDDEANTPSVQFSSAASWSVHPLVALLSLDGSAAVASETGASDADIADAINGFVRSRMSALANEADANQTTVDPASVGGATGGLAYANQEQTLRSLSPIFPAHALAADPAAQRRRFDLQQLLLWRSTRALEDFWGPLPSDDPAAEPALLFQVVANDYLSAAETALPLSPTSSDQLERIRQTTLLRAEAARRGLEVWANSSSLFDLSEQLNAEVKVIPQIAAEALPSGRASIMIENNDVLVKPKVVDEGNGNQPMLELPLLGKKPVELTVELPNEIISDPTLAAVVSFRGHRFSSPFFIEGMEGVVIRHAATEAGNPQLTLFGDRRQRSSIVFVLDCSFSMNEEILVEAMGDERRSRLDLAKSALQSMLSDLALRGDSRVGVRFFGHRVAWSSDAPLRVMANTRYARSIPEGLAPSEDVEAVQTLGRFDTVEAGKVFRLMETVNGLGQSPLYLALMQSENDFSRDDRDTEKSIVVITDGANFQFTPLGADNRGAGENTRNQVIDQWRKHGVPIHIMGFGIDDDERADAEAEFRKIARDTGGSYHPVNNGSDLLRLLNEQLGLGGYFVEDTNGNVVTGMADGAPSLIQLNMPAAPDDWQRGPADYVLRFRDLRKPLTLYGGETLEMVLASGAVDIDAVPYDRNFPVARELTEGDQGKSTGYLLRCHQPLLHNGRVTFPISWQDQRSHFTRRPAEMWTVITPVDQQGNDIEPSYLFYDLNFAPRKPVPLVELTAEKWPAQARQARVRLFCKPQTTEPTQVIPLADVAARPQEFNKGVDLRAIEGVSMRIETRRDATTGEFLVSAIEQHGDTSPGVDSLKVEITGAAGLAQIVHQFDRKHRIVVHTFRFPAAAEQSLFAGGAAIRLTTFDEIRDGSWHLPRNRAVLVNIQKHADVFPPEAADVPLLLRPPAN